MINNEKAILDYLNLPAVPKKKWDGASSFKDGVAVVELSNGGQAYAVATFDKEKDKEPRIKHTFSSEPFKSILGISVVPAYMDLDVENMDLDVESKQAAKRLVEESKELEAKDEKNDQSPKNEYYFDHIHNDEEAAAYIKSYNKTNKIRARVPKKHDELIMRLSVIWSESKMK